MIQNGYLVQAINITGYLPRHFKYEGMNAFSSYPLLGLQSDRSKELSDRQMQMHKGEGVYSVFLEFISDRNLLEEYVDECIKQGIETRCLLIESDYHGEHLLFPNEVPVSHVLGYELCTVPLDNQIVTDLDWFQPLFKFHSSLNQFGLFDDLDKAKEFEAEYNKYYQRGTIGDNFEYATIFRVSTLWWDSGLPSAKKERLTSPK